ncbi:alpha/beta hydrolase fold domain-containing protein [Paraburkholderia sp. J41]|uniref:alpha/beta hydrolase fold domain-containing protein n=1 Tax=Paraburkholderia sp. J41 TaxID=2805433 RepID=UPI002AC34CE7|nr:alpha/beta hydrolase fold domain-containing protein [Paraburkholderia sp. J41]
MPGAELLQMADFYADLADRWPAGDIRMQRDVAERLHMLATEPEGVTYAEVDAGGVPAIWAIPVDSSPDHVLLHSHSGGSVVSSMYMDRKAVAHLAKAAGMRALIINFRLAPENKFPAQLDDVEAAFNWLLSQGFDASRIVSIGHSIGGNYAVNLALTLARKGMATPGAVLSMSPWFDMEVKHKTVQTHAHLDKQLTREMLLGFSDLMLDGTGVSRSDPRINLAHADPAGLPPTMIYYGDQEILAGDAIDFAERAQKAGVDVTLRALAGGQHNFILGAGRVPEIDASIVEMAGWMRARLGLPAVA